MIFTAPQDRLQPFLVELEVSFRTTIIHRIWVPVAGVWRKTVLPNLIILNHYPFEVVLPR